MDGWTDHLIHQLTLQNQVPSLRNSTSNLSLLPHPKNLSSQVITKESSAKLQIQGNPQKPGPKLFEVSQYPIDVSRYPILNFILFTSIPLPHTPLYFHQSRFHCKCVFFE